MPADDAHALLDVATAICAPTGVSAGVASSLLRDTSPRFTRGMAGELVAAADVNVGPGVASMLVNEGSVCSSAAALRTKNQRSQLSSREAERRAGCCPPGYPKDRKTRTCHVARPCPPRTHGCCSWRMHHRCAVRPRTQRSPWNVPFLACPLLSCPAPPAWWSRVCAPQLLFLSGRQEIAMTCHSPTTTTCLRQGLQRQDPR